MNFSSVSSIQKLNRMKEFLWKFIKFLMYLEWNFYEIKKKIFL